MDTSLTEEGQHKMNSIVFFFSFLIFAPSVFLVNFISHDFGIYTMVAELQFMSYFTRAHTRARTCVCVCVCVCVFHVFSIFIQFYVLYLSYFTPLSCWFCSRNFRQTGITPQERSKK